MGCCVGGIRELVGDPGTGDGCGQGFCLCYGGQHAAGTGGQHQLGTVGGHQLLALQGHGVGHDDDAMIAPLGTDSSQTDPRVAGGGLDDGGAGTDESPVLSIIQHGPGHPVLGRAAGVAGFQLHKQTAVEIVGSFQTQKTQQGGAADELLGSGKDVGHRDHLRKYF